jgi:hypothetical protein
MSRFAAEELPVDNFVAKGCLEHHQVVHLSTDSNAKTLYAPTGLIVCPQVIHTIRDNPRLSQVNLPLQ